MPISLKLEHVIEEALHNHPRDQKRALKKLTGIKLSKSAAQRAWPHIIEHKWYLSERLGRDVGLRVAAIDFFENIQSPNIFEPNIIKDDTLPERLPMMTPFNER